MKPQVQKNGKLGISCNVPSNDHRMKFGSYRIYISIILLLMMIIIPIIAFSFSYAYSETITPESSSQSRAVAPEVKIDYSPKNPVDQQPVNVTIESKFGHEFMWAYLYITFIKNGIPRTGNYEFNSYNSTNWYVIIPGDQNQGDTDVSFYATVGFDVVDLKTDELDYRVSYESTWGSSDFYENVKLEYSPTQPGATELVNVTINSIFSNVPIKHALLRVRVGFPGGHAVQEGGVNFTRTNSTSLYSVIPGYGGGTNVTFWVEAYDDAMSRLKSDEYSYVVANPPESTAPQFLYVYVIDDAKEDFIDNAYVTISNDTWSYSNRSINGIVWAPFALNHGEYKIQVSYENDVLIQKVMMPTVDENYTIVMMHFNIAKSKGLVVDFEEFPLWFVNAAIIITILACPMFYYFYTELQRRAKEQEAEMKKKMSTERRKRTQIKALSSKVRTGSRSRTEKQRASTLEFFKSLWQPGKLLRKILSDEEYKITSVKILGFFLLGIFGATWAPFYPWWMVLFIGIIVGAIAYRFPFLALLVLIMFVIGSTAYQYPTFGWLFMIFALIISVCSLFDWRFGFLVFLTLFLSRLGVAIMVPVITGMLLSLFMGLAVAIASGIFFTFLVTCGDITILSFFIGPDHKYGFITFSKPAIADFAPTHYTDALISINDINLEGLTTILHSNYTSMIPFIQIIIWTLIVFVITYLFQEYAKEDLKRSLLLSLIPAFILIGSATGSLFIFEHEINLNTWALIFGIIGMMLTIITFSFMNMELFKEFYLGKTKEMPIGTRIGEMLTLRKTSFGEIGGLKEIKRELKDTMIGPLLRPQKAKEYGVEPPRGIMMFGPPGCGKTLLMRALATELNVEMVGVRCSDVMSKWYGESESMIEKLFKAVKERKPCILFLDEIDAIAKRRDFYSADDVTPRLLSIMLSELDGMDEASGVIVVGATNKPELVDPALMRPGRFDKIIFIPAPDFKSRLEIFKIHLKDKPVSESLNLENLARSTDGFSGADIENLVKESALLAMKRSIRTRRSTVITNTDFLKIIPRIKPSLTAEMKKEYDKLQMDYERKKYGKEIKLPPTEEEAEFALARPRKRVARGAAGASKEVERRQKGPKEPKGRRGRKKIKTWRDVIGLDSSKEFFRNTIENNLLGGK